MLNIVGSKNLIEALTMAGHVLQKIIDQIILLPTMNMHYHKLYPNTRFKSFYTGWELRNEGKGSM